MFPNKKLKNCFLRICSQCDLNLFSWLGSHLPKEQGPIWLPHMLREDASLLSWHKTYAGSVWAGWFCQGGVLSVSWQVVELGSLAGALARVQSPRQAPPHPHCHPSLAQHFLLMKSGRRGGGAGRQWWKEKQHTNNHIFCEVYLNIYFHR